ncbi:MAG: ATP-binding protein [Desulfobacterales bacterium]|nr:ATP-binding protein [Desulfobacterales bacterium]
MNAEPVNASNISSKNEELYEMLLEAIPSSVLVIDKTLSVVSVNRNFLEKNNLFLTETIGQKLEKVFPAVILQRLPVLDQIRGVFQNSEPTHGQRLTYRAPGVPMRVYYYRMIPVIRQRVVENVMFLMDDITQQVQLSEKVQQVERHLASVVESATDIVLSLDAAGRFLSMNPAAIKIFGFAIEDDDGALFQDCLLKDEKKEMWQVFSEMRRGHKPKTVEWNLITKEKASIRVSWIFSPMKDEMSKTIGIVAVGRDLTEQRKLEMELFQSQKLAALGVMAGGVAHEIRNPLAISSSAAQFLMNDDITAEFRKECAAKVNSGIQRAAAIIDNLMKFARPATTHRVEPVELISLLQETVALVSNQARIQKIEIISHLSGESITVRGIYGLLQQLFLNLFLNAIAAMPNGGILTLAAESRVRDVLLRITDTGGGIPEKNIEKIFDPFFTTASMGEGIGLGLSIAYAIVKQHTGTIEVHSAKGKGSNFIVKLPIQ